MYISITYYGDGNSINEFGTFTEAFDYATRNSYGNSFKIAKIVDYKVTATEE